MQTLQKREPDTTETDKSTSLEQKNLGFVIENITAHLPDFGEDPLFLGWIFHFTKKPETSGKSVSRTPIANIKDIRVSEVRLKPALGRSYKMKMIDITPALSIEAFVHIQKNKPVFGGNSSIDYDGCLGATLSSFKPASDANSPIKPLIEKLEGYMCWADAAYIRATDLRLLKTYLDGDAAGYNAVFFSGANVDYSTMNNARLRLEQRYLLLDPSILRDNPNEFKKEDLFFDKKNNKTYLNSSTSFTLKAEPIYIGPPRIIGNKSLSQTDNFIDSVDGEMMPGAFPLIGCPKYWTVMQALRDEAKIITGNTDNTMMPVEYAELDNMGTMMDMLNAKTPLSDPVTGTWLARMLRSLADLIDSIFS